MAYGTYETVISSVASFPTSSVAKMAKTLGPSSSVAVSEKLPTASTSTSSALTLTVAPGIVLPRMVMALCSTMAPSAGSRIARVKGSGVAVGVGVGGAPETRVLVGVGVAVADPTADVGVVLGAIVAVGDACVTVGVVFGPAVAVGDSVGVAAGEGAPPHAATARAAPAATLMVQSHRGRGKRCCFVRIDHLPSFVFNITNNNVLRPRDG